VKQGLIYSGREAEKTLVIMTLMPESHWWYLFHNEVKKPKRSIQPSLEFDNFKPLLRSSIFKYPKDSIILKYSKYRNVQLSAFPSVLIQ
jgi:hypothetical protein